MIEIETSLDDGALPIRRLTTRSPGSRAWRGNLVVARTITLVWEGRQSPAERMDLPIPIGIATSVGDRGTNRRADVKTVQILLLMNRAKFSCQPLPMVDGHATETLNASIAAFQNQVESAAHPSGRVEPRSSTLKALTAGAPIGLTKEKLQLILPAATAAGINTYFQPIVNGTRSYEISAPLRLCHFLAQIGLESADLRYTEEIASGQAYEGRRLLGNTQPGDGVRFKGRGLIQLTGRTNYTAYGRAKGQDFVTGVNPSKLAHDPDLAVDVACWFWAAHGLNGLADRDDVVGITKVINGGFNGIQLRTARLMRAKFWMGLSHGVVI